MKRFLREKTHYLTGLYTPEKIDEFLAEHSHIKAPIFCGRSNVGKSSLINALFKNKIAKASKTPGKTKDIQVFRTQITDIEEPFYIFDLPGFGHARVSKEERKRWDDILGYFFERISNNLLILHILDSRNPLQQHDHNFRDFIQNFDLKYWAIFNKTDKIKNQKEKNQFKERKKKIEFHQEFSVSALKKRNIEKLEQSLIEYFTAE